MEYRAIVLILLLLLGACSSGQPQVFFVSWSPGGERKAIAAIADNGISVGVAVTDQKTGRIVGRWELFGEDYDRAWVGWSRNGKRLSVLTCSQGYGARVDRFSLDVATEDSLGTVRAEFAEADDSLRGSLRELVKLSPEEARRASDDVFDWYCTGYGGSALRAFPGVKKNEIHIPPYVLPKVSADR